MAVSATSASASASNEQRPPLLLGDLSWRVTEPSDHAKWFNRQPGQGGFLGMTKDDWLKPAIEAKKVLKLTLPASRYNELHSTIEVAADLESGSAVSLRHLLNSIGGFYMAPLNRFDIGELEKLVAEGEADVFNYYVDAIKAFHANEAPLRWEVMGDRQFFDGIDLVGDRAELLVG